MEHPHNAVLLLCSSHEKGCRPFLCDTSYRHSNCFDQYRKSSAATNLHGEQQSELLCPFCRGTITGVDVKHPARKFMDSKTRNCSLETCSFSGNYAELRKHARLEHPSKRPSEASPTRQTNWTMQEQQREIEDAFLYQSDIDVWPSFNEVMDDDFWSEGSFFDFPSGMSDVGDDVIEEMLSGLSTSCFSLYSFSHDDDMMDSGNSRIRDQPQRAIITGPRFNAHLGNATPSYHSENVSDASRSIPGYQREHYSLNLRPRSGYGGETNSSSGSSYHRVDDAASSRTRSSYSRENGEIAPESSRRSSYRWEDAQPNSMSRSRSAFYGREFAPRPVRAYATRSFSYSSRQTRSDPGGGGV